MRHLALRSSLLALILATAQPAAGQDPRREDRPPSDVLARRQFVLAPVPLDELRIVGLPAGSRPAVLTWQRVYRLALIQARVAPRPRFETLQPDRLDEEAQRLGLDDFARFRADFSTSRTFADPAASLLDLQARHLAIDDAGWNLAYAERWTQLLKDLINGEASGVGLVDLDQAQAAVNTSRRAMLRLISEYRDRLDRFKVALGLAPQATVTIDLAPLAPFREVFEAIDRWCLTASRELSDLDEILRRLPPLGDVTIGGRAIIDEVEADPDRLEEMLALTTRFALGNRREQGEPADAVELRTRRRLRYLIEIRQNYRIEARATVLAVRLLDGVFEQIIAPPAGDAQPRRAQATGGIAARIAEIAEHRGRLVTLWTTFQAERLAFERDLGVVIAADWPSFLGRFTAQPAVIEPVAPVEPEPKPVAPAPPQP